MGEKTTLDWQRRENLQAIPGTWLFSDPGQIEQIEVISITQQPFRRVASADERRRFRMYARIYVSRARLLTRLVY